jgi:glutathione S-transferase
MYELIIGNKNYSSWSLRPWVLMRELGLPFTERLVPFGSMDFKALSPSGRVPVLKHGDTTVWDSLAIAEYLAERHPVVWPVHATARAWARSAAAEMHAGFGALRQACSMTCGQRVKLARVSSALQADLDRLASLWTEGLTRFGGPFLAGPAFTAVDAFFAPVAFRVRTYQLQLPPGPAAYAAMLLALPSLQAWDAEALQESFREASHEADVAAAGTVLEDLRVPAMAVKAAE